VRQTSACESAEPDYLNIAIYSRGASVPQTKLIFFYFFHGRHVAVLASGLTKESEIPPAEIDRAMARKRLFEQDPNGHSYEETEDSRPH